MLEVNLERCHAKIEATNFFLVFSFYSQSLDKNEFFIVLVTLLLEVGVSITKVAKIWELCNISNLVTSITPLPKDIIPKHFLSLWAFGMIVKSVEQTPILLLLLVFASNFSHSTFARVFHCFVFFKILFSPFSINCSSPWNSSLWRWSPLASSFHLFLLPLQSLIPVWF